MTSDVILTCLIHCSQCQNANAQSSFCPQCTCIPGQRGVITTSWHGERGLPAPPYHKIQTGNPKLSTQSKESETWRLRVTTQPFCATICRQVKYLKWTELFESEGSQGIWCTWVVPSHLVGSFCPLSPLACCLVSEIRNWDLIDPPPWTSTCCSIKWARGIKSICSPSQRRNLDEKMFVFSTILLVVRGRLVCYVSVCLHVTPPGYKVTWSIYFAAPRFGDG